MIGEERARVLSAEVGLKPYEGFILLRSFFDVFLMLSGYILQTVAKFSDDSVFGTSLNSNILLLFGD